MLVAFFAQRLHFFEHITAAVAFFTKNAHEQRNRSIFLRQLAFNIPNAIDTGGYAV